jgi:hypothetical protein
MISFSLTLTIQLVPKVSDGIFRMEVNLLDATAKMEEGAFPTQWHHFAQKLVKDMIERVIWPKLKTEIENLTSANGLQIPDRCGLEPRSMRLFVDGSRFGLSASLLLDEFSAKECLRGLRSKIPDPSKLFVVKEGA